MNLGSSWQLFALGSAFFAGLTAIFGKFGVTGMNSNFATFIRTVIILFVIAGIVTLRHEWQKPALVSSSNWIFLTLSAIATGLSWLCYYHALQIGPVSKVAPIDKLSVAFAIVLGLLFANEQLTWPVAIGGSLIVAGSVVIIAF